MFSMWPLYPRSYFAYSNGCSDKMPLVLGPYRVASRSVFSVRVFFLTYICYVSSLNNKVKVKLNTNYS